MLSEHARRMESLVKLLAEHDAVQHHIQRKWNESEERYLIILEKRTTYRLLNGFPWNRIKHLSLRISYIK